MDKAISQSTKTAAIIIIGDEILSGRVKDSNAAFLMENLHQAGIEISKVSIIKDDIDIIANEIAYLSTRCDYLFTAGGVGPTHDDITIEGLAKAFNTGVIIHPILHDIVKHYAKKEELNEGELKLASVPEGATLFYSKGTHYPTVTIGNVFIFPGVPEILRAKFNAIAHFFSNDRYYYHELYLNTREEIIVLDLNTLVKKHHTITIGSYPLWTEPIKKVKLTMESKNENSLTMAFEDFLETFKPYLVEWK